MKWHEKLAAILELEKGALRHSESFKPWQIYMRHFAHKRQDGIWISKVFAADTPEEVTEEAWEWLTRSDFADTAMIDFEQTPSHRFIKWEDGQWVKTRTEDHPDGRAEYLAHWAKYKANGQH